MSIESIFSTAGALPEGSRFDAIESFAEFFVGLALILGFATRYAVLVMLFYMIVASFSSHNYWSVPEAQRVNQMAHFWKNISMMGGMILLFITGAGRYSLDAILARRR